jgi:SAM-dependent methyltransferase
MPSRSLVQAFRRAGYAALSDLTGEGYAALFEELEAVQAEFLAGVASFRDPEYRWEADTLHTWARAWEYAYAAYHVGGEQRRAGAPLTLVDFGSGSTFFPFAMARGGARVRCFDNDPASVRDLHSAIAALSAAPGNVVVQQNGARLPLDDGAADAAYSISVLEHMDDPVPIVAELARVLKPGGLLVLTMDIDVEGDAGVSPPHFDALREQLAERFAWAYPEHTVHPADVLTSKSSPWPRPGERHVPGLLWRTRDRRLVPLVGGPTPGVLTVYGCVLRRR